MEVEYADDKLALIETERAAETKLPIAVINSARKKIHFIRQSKDERDLRNWKSLHYEQLSGDRAGERTIRLNDKWRLVFYIYTNEVPTRILVLKIEGDH